MGVAVRAEGISKEYYLGVIGNGTLYKDLQSFWAKIRGKEDPNIVYQQGGRYGCNDRFWAIKDVSFDLQQGERLGILGRNGAGKSTLLKILSRITAPTEGKCFVKGKMVSLLEVGTGFHPELTGRENIYLNGAILGMKKAEIRKKFDEIVAFSEIENFIDTPVKRYSSGMYVRLAFAVAAHLDADIIVADEVLAIGDVKFQQKSLGKMHDVSMNEGKTVIFVSHNSTAVQSLCNSGIILENGSIMRRGFQIEEIVSEYNKMMLG
jgi:lipopolysaccharide transport system ATP-binding protein